MMREQIIKALVNLELFAHVNLQRNISEDSDIFDSCIFKG